MKEDKKVNVYIDGFNFYFGLKSKRWKKYYWLDIVQFFESLMKQGQVLENVYYFTASQKSKSKKERQDLLFQANKQNPKFKLVYGKFLFKKMKLDGKIHRIPEEKQTDVNIATYMIGSVVKKQCDISILVSGDSDLMPPIKLIRELEPEHKIFVHFPPNRFSNDLKKHSDAIINLERYERSFKKNILPSKITISSGYTIQRPDSWY